MEIFGIILSIPAAFIASAVYSLILVYVISGFGVLRTVMWWSSLVVIACFIIEAALLASLGAVSARAFFGPAFYVTHLGVFFLGVPALANLIVLRTTRDTPAAPIKRLAAATLCCTAFALVLVLMQYGVSEALYGIDDEGGPFSHDVRGGSEAV